MNGQPWPLLMGVRHHGPGSARAVRAVLERYEPGALLIEGPPEADAMAHLAGEEGMRPPVALLAHVLDDPGRAAFWPLAEFSPEWVALRWAVARGVPVRFIDLPAAHTLALTEPGATEPVGPDRSDRPDRPDQLEGPEGREPESRPDGSTRVVRAARIDPLAVLARAAGYDDPERWWEDAVEHRGTEEADWAADAGDDAGNSDVLAPFLALADAMTALREAYDRAGQAQAGPGQAGPAQGGPGHGGGDHDAVREAHMRLRLREARREFGEQVAVVCGAWHVPALMARSTVAADRALLKGLPKAKATLTWVPWTHRRLSRRSGYGAGIDSPGWYAHLFSAPDRPLQRWMTKVAGLLRAEDYAVSPAHVIEAVRLAETLAVLRGRPLAGLTEAGDAVRAVMGDGSDAPSSLIHDRLVVGDALGEVPEGAPAVPLQRDIDREQRSLRLKPEAHDRDLELDLRKDTDAARSRLLHRLRLLGVPWGEPAPPRTGTGTFRESWRLRWEPELSVRVAEAGIWGTTVVSAATSRAEADAVGARTLADVTALAERCLLAGLPDALPVVMRALTDRAALDADVGHLAQALPALVRSVRYGDVRGTDATALGEVATGLAERVFVGLPPACVGLDEEGAAEMRRHLDATHQAVVLLGQTDTGPPRGPGKSGSGTPGAGKSESGTFGAGMSGAGAGLRARWSMVLHKLAVRDAVAGLVRGRAARLLLDDGRTADGGAERLMGLALSPGTPPPRAAAWIEGFFGGGDGGGLLLVHDERLLALVDGWLTGIPADAFTDVLPLLRRTFAEYDPAVRRTLGELVRRGPVGATAAPGSGSGGQDAAAPGFGPGLDRDRAAAVLPTLRVLLDLTGTNVTDPAHEPEE
ncbi:DUF5682 family protein [Streptomyces sp. MST-110588]|uniref:DUF5682 family protein n=1 Tax=Streptomyces sp. MST-110588 TaxID=2833628 RepID=UPI001F5DA4F0|nr:DUF5682 family protein [Streptomyces sp. MST-110588]UNO40329.1 hypothetical protein KGS77_13000 [Streptomyces sp. MST-110588]